MLSVRNLRLFHKETGAPVFPDAVERISFDLNPGEKLGIIGESGAGKTLTALSIPGLLPSKIGVSGDIIWKGKNLRKFSEKEWRQIRGKEIAVIFQDSLSALDPLQNTASAIGEMFSIHEKRMPRAEKKQRVQSLLEKVCLPTDTDFLKTYPHEISGGQRQRVAIAMAMACNPDLIIADEPTGSLDSVTREQITDLLAEISRDAGTALIYISHHLESAVALTDRVMVFHAGAAVEKISSKDFFAKATHSYSRELIASSPVSLSGNGSSSD